jgi:hypothetical protein
VAGEKAKYKEGWKKEESFYGSGGHPGKINGALKI